MVAKRWQQPSAHQPTDGQEMGPSTRWNIIGLETGMNVRQRLQPMWISREDTKLGEASQTLRGQGRLVPLAGGL